MGAGRSHLESFKAYDVRGRVPDQLNEDLAELIGRGYAALVEPKRVAVGHDIRLTSPSLSAALSRGLTAEGVDVVDIGLVGTEQTYFATFDLELDGGVMITASHNPRDYNGMKFTRAQARPISADTGLLDIEAWVQSALSERHGGLGGERAPGSQRQGRIEKTDIGRQYIAHLLTYIDASALEPLKVVVNAGNGGAGLIIDMLEPLLPLRFVKINNEPDGAFPSGVPNPILPENRSATGEVVIREGADLGIAWDGDFDRCFFFDEKGQFVEGYYLVGLLAQRALRRHPGARIIHDPRLVWNTEELVREAGGIPVVCKSGHAFIKEKMREVDAAYGGEMSAHHYFREFAYCDSGMIPWLQVVEAMSQTGRPFSEMVEERIKRFPVSGEINLTLRDPPGALEKLRSAYLTRGGALDETDGLSFDFVTWRFNVRSSNTEPVVRLNVETRADPALLEARTQEVLAVLRGED